MVCTWNLPSSHWCPAAPLPPLLLLVSLWFYSAVLLWVLKHCNRQGRWPGLRELPFLLSYTTVKRKEEVSLSLTFPIPRSMVFQHSLLGIFSVLLTTKAMADSHHQRVHLSRFHCSPCPEQHSCSALSVDWLTALTRNRSLLGKNQLSSASDGQTDHFIWHHHALPLTAV